jgi:hypothetical protein
VLELTADLKAPGEVVTTCWERDAAGHETVSAIDGDPDTHHPVRWHMRGEAKTNSVRSAGEPESS